MDVRRALQGAGGGGRGWADLWMVTTSPPARSLNRSSWLTTASMCLQLELPGLIPLRCVW